MTVVDLRCINIGLETVEKIEEIRAYIKVRTKLDHSLWMQIFSKGGGVMGLSDKLSYKTVRAKKKKESLTGQSPSKIQQDMADMWLTSNANIFKVMHIIENGGGYTIRDIAKAVGMSLAGCISFWSVYWKYERFLPDWYRNIDRWPKTKKTKKPGCEYNSQRNGWKCFLNSTEDILQILLLMTKHEFTISNW